MVSKSLRIVFYSILAAFCLTPIYSGAEAQTTAAPSEIVFTQPADPGGALLPFQSSQLGYDWMGNDYDQYIWDDFTLTTSRTLTAVDWRGVYTSGGYWGGPVADFVISIWASNPLVSSEPDVVHPPLVQYTVGGNAGENPLQPTGQSSQSYHDYHYVFSSPFVATAGTKYWIQIEAIQNGATDWGIVAGTGGDAHCFGSHVNYAGGNSYWSLSGDAAFALSASSAPAITIAASASPANGGTILGAGGYAPGANVSLVATPNPGFGFVDWTENGAQVSTSASYNFTASTNRTLVANFVPTYNVAVSASPVYGGTVSGGGTFNSASNVSVVATPSPGFVFVNWTEFGAEVSTASNYSFAASSDRTLVANFVLDANSTTFDFDTGSPLLSAGQSTPLNQTSAGVNAYFTSPTAGAGGFSVQTDSTTQFHMSQFVGNYLNPNSVYNPALDIEFNRELTSISFTFATADFNQAEVPTTIKLTAYQGSTGTTPVGSATAHGTYAGDTMPMGTLTFSSPTPFNVVEITIPPAPAAASDFLADNITATVVGTPACTTKPAKPVLTSPKKGATSKTRSLYLDWNPATCAQNYKVTIRHSSNKGIQVDERGTTDVTGYTTKVLLKSKTYSWQVSACNQFGCTASGWRSFTISKKAK